jgi:hypothetical protein
MPSLARAASSAGGGVLAAATAVLAALRPARKPLHPDGEILAARVFRSGSAEPTGVGWLDEPGEDDADVRLSRAVGLPGALPDIHGLALRVHAPDGVGDVLFATTGLGRLTRFLLTPSRGPQTRPMTTLLPYRTDTGAVVLAAEAIGVEVYELSWARPDGPWHAFAVLRLSTGRREQHLSFDPVVHQITGLEQYPSVRRLRGPAYRRARHSRGDDVSPTTATTTQENTHVQ